MKDHPQGARGRRRLAATLLAAAWLARAGDAGAAPAANREQEIFPEPAAAGLPPGALAPATPDLGALTALPASRRGDGVAGGRSVLAGLPPRLDAPLLPAAATTPVAERRTSPWPGPYPSGLPWRSGSSCAEADFEAWRGRKLDSHVVFVWHDTWQQMIDRLSSDYYRNVVRRSPQPVVSIAMLPRSEQSQHARCAAGEFDGYFKRFGRILRQIGAGHAIVRIGWEPNIGAASHPWGIDTAEEVPDYVACFRREAAALRSTAPDVEIEWTLAKASIWPFSVLDAYPGDAYVDVIGTHYYSVNDQFSTDERWNRFSRNKLYGGPQGLRAWVPVVTAAGKRLSVPEWGVWAREVTPAEADLPRYVENMYKFLRDNASIIAYDNYYNCPDSHRLHPTTDFPKSSRRYQQLWMAGQ